MTKVTSQNKALAELVELKKAVINFHKGDHLQYTRGSKCTDNCYSGNNSIAYKTNQMSNLKAEIASLYEGKGAEVIDVKLAKKIDIYHSMEEELDALSLDQDANLIVYKDFFGKDWSARAKNALKDEAVIQAVESILAK